MILGHAVEFYSVLFVMSLVLTLIYAYRWNKHYDINLTLTFVLMPVTIYGYVIMNSADTLHAALNGKKLPVYGDGKNVMLSHTVHHAYRVQAVQHKGEQDSHNDTFDIFYDRLSFRTY